VDTAGPGFATSPAVVFDSNGNSLVTWEQGDGLHYHINFSRLASGATAWSAPVQVDTAPADATASRLAADAHGHVVAIRVQSELVQGNFTSRIWSSTYTSAGTWGAPVVVGGDPNSRVNDGRVVSNAAGIAQALWQQTDGSLWSNRYTPGTGWDTTPKRVEAAGNGAYTPELAIDPNGNVLAVWQKANPQVAHISYSRFSANEGWSTPALI